MIILTIRTDKPQAELGLFQDDQQLAYETWLAHRQLAETIHLKIKSLLGVEHKQLHDIEAIAIYQGPGSFTGLRIGISVANALALALKIPICSAENEDWLQAAMRKLRQGHDEKIVLPAYGAEVHITQPKH
jgi:tRNA threonylcarbamoyladenosine biosynthesis protein TsaB